MDCRFLLRIAGTAFAEWLMTLKALRPSPTSRSFLRKARRRRRLIGGLDGSQRLETEPRKASGVTAQPTVYFQMLARRLLVA